MKVFCITASLSIASCHAAAYSLEDLLVHPKCGVTGFSVFDSASYSSKPIEPFTALGGFALGRVILDKYPDGKINIIANVGPPCDPSKPIKCVRVNLYDEQKERFPPYTAFPSVDDFDLAVVTPSQLGWHNISASTFTDTDCTEGESGSLEYSLHLVPTTQKTIRTGSPPFIAEYVGTRTSSSYDDDTKAVANVTCEVMRRYLSDGFIYKFSMSLLDFHCVPIPVTGLSTDLKIKYYMAATYEMNEEVNMYENPDFPTQEKMIAGLATVFKSKSAVSPSGPTLLDKIKSDLPSTNLYYGTTEVRV